MNKNRILWILTLGLTAVAIFLFVSRNPFTIKKELRDFAILDTASVNKIFLADKTGKSVTLERKADGFWLVNQKYIARSESIDLLLYTMQHLVVKHPVAKAAMESLLKHMAANAVKVEIYQKNELSKTYYVGGATQDQLGTFMLLENSSAPFVMELPGHNGYLTTRYFTDETQWRNRIIFNSQMSDIQSVQVTYPSSPEKDFILENKKGGQFLIANGNADKMEKADPLRDTLAAVKYLGLFRNIQFEQVVREINPQKRDSVLASNPHCIIRLNTFDGKNAQLKMYTMPVNEHSLMKGNEDGPLVSDVDRMYGLLDDGTLTIVQHFVLDPVMLSYQAFMRSK